MPRYLLHTIDEQGEFDEYIGEREAVNSREALAMLTESTDPFDEYDPTNLRAVVAEFTLSGEDIQQGTV